MKLITIMNHADNESSSTLTGPNKEGPENTAVTGSERRDVIEKKEVTADKMTIAESAITPFAPTFLRRIIETMEIKRTAIRVFTQPAKFISITHQGFFKRWQRKEKIFYKVKKSLESDSLNSFY